MKEALSWVKASGWKEVVVESDCLGVIQAIRSNVSMLSSFSNIVTECRRLLVELNIYLFFVKRSANMAAHCLARESCFFQVEYSIGVLFLLKWSHNCWPIYLSNA